MAWNGSGTFTRTNGVFSGATVWAQDAAVPTNITTAHFDTHDQDLAQGINACLAKNGENAMTGDLNLGGKGITNALTSRLTSTVAITLGSTTHALQIGATAAQNLSASDRAIEARNNGAVSDLFAQTLGGALQVGTLTAPVVLVGGSKPLINASGGGNSAALAAARFSADNAGPFIVLGKSRHATVGSNTIVQSGDLLGSIVAYGANGTGFDQAAQISAYVDNTPGASGDMPGRWSFFTTPDGSASPVERFRILSTGELRMFGDTNFFSQYKADGTTRSAYWQGTDGGGSMQIASEITSNVVNIYGRDSGAVQRGVFQGDPNGAGRLYWIGTESFSTQNRAANGTGSGARVLDGGGTFRDVGFNTLSRNTQNTSYTFARTDAGAMVHHSSGSHTWTTPANSDTTMPTDTVIMGINEGGTLTIAAGASVTLSWFNGGGSVQTGSRTIAVGGVFTLHRWSASSWVIWGTGIS